MKEKIKKAANFLKDNDNFCFLCHKNLDGDTFGAAYALYYAVLGLNKKSIVKTFENETNEKFSFLLSVNNNIAADEDFEIKNYVAVDVADLHMLEEQFLHKEISLVIDHHESNLLDAKISCVDAKMAASCELVYLILKELNVKITKNIANCLYLGIVTDTGCFKYENTTPLTHSIAADLIAKGAQHFNINFYIFDKKTKARLKLEGLILDSLEYYFNDRVVIVFITDDMILQSKASEEDQMSVAQISSCFDEAFFAITAREQEQGFKISVRTKKEYDACLLCKCFGGGGHKKAAGCFIKGRKLKVKEQILNKIKEEFSF